MNNVIDEVLAGDPRYTIKDNDGVILYDNVQIDLKTLVTTPGTPLNKALFDSIENDLNSRLLISNKASQVEAEAGTNDTKYITPLKMQQKIKSLVTTGTYTAGTNTIVNFLNYSNAKIIEVSGSLTGATGTNTCYLGINGTGITGYIFDGTTTQVTASTEVRLPVEVENGRYHAFNIKFDLNSKTFYGTYYGNDSKVKFIQGNFTSITTFQARLYLTATASVTVQANA